MDDGGDDNSLFTDITADQYSGALPRQFTYPFHYEPHPVATWACDQVKKQLTETDAFQEDVGKMFGVLIVRRTTDQCLGYLKAFSGTLNKSPLLMDADGGGSFCFCPVIYDRMDPKGFYKQGEAELNAINEEVEELEQHPERVQRRTRLAAIDLAKKRLGTACRQQKARKQQRKQLLLDKKANLVENEEEYQALEYSLKIQESATDQRQIKAFKAQLQLLVAQAQSSSSCGEIEGRIKNLKQLRQEKSIALQNRLFGNYQFLNILGEKALVLDIFTETALRRPPAGTGDCAAPKLLQAAFARGYTPIAMAEFWWGGSPVLEVRKHNFYYPACRGKCEPILGHMLQGLDVEDNPLILHTNSPELEIVFEDEYIVVVNKPAEMLSVPGRQVQHSVYTEMKKRYPNATGPLLVHRLDMSTSGVLLVAKDKDIHKKLSAQFIDRSVKKRYECLLEGECTNDPKGKIDIPLTGDYLNRPMQKVDFDTGKPAVTFYEVIKVAKGRTRIYFYPVTGRTHQLRVHAAHAMGLNIPIVGDDIYGQRDERLCLHAGFLQLTHPVTQKRMTFTTNAPF
jgi:tRNA pseudouridine32 synthase/23S rRNA pseudouridine746 synthase